MKALLPMLLVVAGCGPTYTPEQIAAAKAAFCEARESASEAVGDTASALAELEAAKAEGDPDAVRTRVLLHEAAKGLEESYRRLRQIAAHDLLDMGIEPADVDCHAIGEPQ